MDFFVLWLSNVRKIFSHIFYVSCCLMMYETIHKCCIFFVKGCDAVLNPTKKYSFINYGVLRWRKLKLLVPAQAHSDHHNNFHQKLTCWLNENININFSNYHEIDCSYFIHQFKYKESLYGCFNFQGHSVENI